MAAISALCNIYYIFQIRKKIAYLVAIVLQLILFLLSNLAMATEQQIHLKLLFRVG